MNVQERIEVERKVVRHLIQAMKAKGWDIRYINDGEDSINNPNETLAMDTVFSVDECWIYFTKQIPDGRKFKHVAYIVLGNDGWDCIADHGFSIADEPLDDFEHIMDEIYQYCESLSS